VEMEDYLDLTTDEKLLAWWDEHCELVPDQTHISGVPPVPGMPYKKCTFRDQDQVFGGTVPGSTAFLSRQKAVAIIKTNEKKTHVIPRKLVNYFIWQNEFDEEHVPHVASVHTPGMIACGCVKKGEDHILFCYLIDGTRRAVAAMREGRPFEAYVLSFKETAQYAMTESELRRTVRL
jgi:hypothetical protein